MAYGKTDQGQLYQSATTQFTLTTVLGFSYTLKGWKDAKFEFGAESKIANNMDGSIAGYTTDPVKTSASVKLRLDEWDDLEVAWLQFDPTTPLLQQVFDVTLAMGNSLARRRKDSAKIKFQKDVRDLPESSDPLFVDCPMLLLDWKKNGLAVMKFPVG